MGDADIRIHREEITETSDKIYSSGRRLERPKKTDQDDARLEKEAPFRAEPVREASIEQLR